MSERLSPLARLRAVLARPNSDRSKTLLVSLLVALGCGLSVSIAAVVLRPAIQANVAAARSAQMSAMLAGIPGIGEILARAGADAIETAIVDLASGLRAEGVDAAGFDQAAIAADAGTSTQLTRAQDVVGLGRRENLARVHLVRREGKLALIVLPVRGRGYQSTIRAYLALEGDLDTVAAFTVYDHGETPGLGARIADAAWQAQWAGKKLTEGGKVAIEVVTGTADGPNEVDGISGASVTGYAITDMIHFWLGPLGYGRFLERLRAGEFR
ncbi:NADH:ubiquinone reductase (Na(+)-transporting) subunit C [Bosea sp. (in: a-proteobacteria)]|uniref:NADH:ubiquinone reductase (Na(+)-transporting) subunit C n=1 Tax=Bosea sp. (in: a-proteobacteria) TaxID=1871050 RepID=UPI002631D9E6|nr:NADH:ubiquinone reductase (Na(+)-transporting) subunit C [Bosea sp. (in: a-proteobacteria)]MCO5093578.1 NADH:ubiquinone reductase (Na(+)-transporting) subunit C [Bosea sp. (in: a-proteobacteria)]